jgi:hypothetical protein
MRTPARKTPPLNLQTFTPDIEVTAKRISKTTQWAIYISALLLNDLLILILAMQFSYIIRFVVGLPIFQLDAIPAPAYYTQLISIGSVMVDHLCWSWSLPKDQFAWWYKRICPGFESDIHRRIFTDRGGFS